MEILGINLTDRNSRLFLFLFAFWLIPVAAKLHAQVPMNARDVKSAVNLSEFERVNLHTGRFEFSLPLASVGGRGLSDGFSLNIDQQWRRETVITGYSGSTNEPHYVEYLLLDPHRLTGPRPNIGGIFAGSTVVLSTGEVAQCSNATRVVATHTKLVLNFNGFNGKSFTLWPVQNEGQPLYFEPYSCVERYQSLGTVFRAYDGSGATFISDSPVLISDQPTSEEIMPSGTIRFPDGTEYGVGGGTLQWVEDRNGNRVEIGSYVGWVHSPSEGYPTIIKDSLNREISVTSSGDTWNDGSHYVNYKGANGVNRSFRIKYDLLSNALRAGQQIRNLDDLFDGVQVNSTVNPPIVKFLELPDGRRYNFSYNSYAELARVELPTGAAIEYDYQSDCGVNLCVTRVLKERRLYSNGVNLDTKTEYNRGSYFEPGEQSPYGSGFFVSVKTTNSSGGVLAFVKHYFGPLCGVNNNCGVTGFYQGDTAGRETRTEIYDTNLTTVLRKTETLYEPRATANWSIVGPWGAGLTKDWRIKKVTNYLSDSNQVSKTEYFYDQTVDYNLRTDAYEYDYGTGAPGNFLRRTHTEYEKGPAYTNSSVSLLSLPKENWVSSDANGSNIVSRTKYEYDNYAADGNHAPLVNRVNVTGHNSPNFGTSFTARGNVTEVTTYADAQNQTGALSVYSQYDILGNVVKTIDAKGNASTIDYSDRFGSPDAEARNNSAPSALSGLQTFAFATNATNVVGYTTYAQFDYYTGASVDNEDIIGNVGTTFYNDLLDRPTQTISANNRPQFRKQVTVVYDDANRKVTVTADSKAFGDNLIKSEAFYDRLGRTTEGKTYENASEYIKSLTQYDSLGRAFKSSTPHRPHLNEQPEWTTTTFDALGRVIQVQTPDNAVVTRSYSGTTTTVTDQAGRKRRGMTDAIGRLLKVFEDPNGLNHETNYVYDVLGRLRKTTQTEGPTTQNRFFMYDDLGRLIRAKQTEQTANANLNSTDPITGNSGWSVKYEYDANGNIISTTDANNRTITGTYDNLNRLTFRNYSDATPDVTFTFDDVNVPNSKGQLTAVATSVSSTFYTAFDDLGRIRSSRQRTNGVDYNFPDYTYDFSGALVSQTYPSGRVVEIETDQIGRLSKVTSQVPSQVERTYLSNIAYTSFGPARHARLGNGRWESAQFDGKTLQIEEMRLGASAGNTSLLKIEYDFGTTDNNGSLKQQKITVPGVANQIIQNYAYDALNHLQSATETVNSQVAWKQTFSYDRFGNRRFDAANTTTLPANDGVYNPQVDLATNRFKVVEGYNYDPEGNITSNPESQLFAYDAENRQTQVQNTATQQTASYFYDGNGKRVRKLVGSEETVFVYDAFGKLVAEYSTVIDSRPKTTNYLTTDDLGSPRVITNHLGQIVTRHDYMPFGEEVLAGVGGRTAAQGYGGSDDVRKQFTGYERDVESGLDYAQARYFRAKHGRFTSVDPLAASANVMNPQTLNRYMYALNSPYKFTDPLGLEPCGHGGGTAGRECTQADDHENQKSKGWTSGKEQYDCQCLESTHIDSSGKVITVFNDGDLGVYQHANNADGKTPTAAQIAKRHAKKGTSAGGTKIGATQYWDEFVSPDTGQVLTDHRILVGTDMTSNIEAINKQATEEMNLYEVAQNSRNGRLLDIKASWGNYGILLNGLYVTTRSAGNYLAGLNAATGTLAGQQIEFETFQKMAGALQVSRQQGKSLTRSQLADIVINGTAYGPAPTYGELEYQRRMSVEGFMRGRNR